MREEGRGEAEGILLYPGLELTWRWAEKTTCCKRNVLGATGSEGVFGRR